jgi:transcriptional regulator with XRE-family HTH domain
MSYCPPTLQSKIASIRQRIGMSQAQAGERIGMSKYGWSYIERGKRSSPTLTTVARIAYALNMRTSDLLAGTEYDVYMPRGGEGNIPSAPSVVEAW